MKENTAQDDDCWGSVLPKSTRGDRTTKRKRTPTAAPSGVDTTHLPYASVFLAVLVPQLTAEMQALDGAAFAAHLDALEAAGVCAEVLPAGGGTPNDEAQALMGLAQALAFVPGGVPFGDHTSAATPTEEEPPCAIQRSILDNLLSMDLCVPHHLHALLATRIWVVAHAGQPALPRHPDSV